MILTALSLRSAAGHSASRCAQACQPAVIALAPHPHAPACRPMCRSAWLLQTSAACGRSARCTSYTACSHLLATAPVNGCTKRSSGTTWVSAGSQPSGTATGRHTGTAPAPLAAQHTDQLAAAHVQWQLAALFALYTLVATQPFAHLSRVRVDPPAWQRITALCTGLAAVRAVQARGTPHPARDALAVVQHLLRFDLLVFAAYRGPVGLPAIARAAARELGMPYPPPVQAQTPPQEGGTTSTPAAAFDPAHALTARVATELACGPGDGGGPAADIPPPQTLPPPPAPTGRRRRAPPPIPRPDPSQCSGWRNAAVLALLHTLVRGSRPSVVGVDPPPSTAPPSTAAAALLAAATDSLTALQAPAPQEEGEAAQPPTPARARALARFTPTAHRMVALPVNLELPAMMPGLSAGLQAALAKPPPPDTPPGTLARALQLVVAAAESTPPPAKWDWLGERHTTPPPHGVAAPPQGMPSDTLLRSSRPSGKWSVTRTKLPHRVRLHKAAQAGLPMALLTPGHVLGSARLGGGGGVTDSPPHQSVASLTFPADATWLAAALAPAVVCLQEVGTGVPLGAAEVAPRAAQATAHAQLVLPAAPSHAAQLGRALAERLLDISQKGAVPLLPFSQDQPGAGGEGWLGEGGLAGLQASLAAAGGASASGGTPCHPEDWAGAPTYPGAEAWSSGRFVAEEAGAILDAEGRCLAHPALHTFVPHPTSGLAATLPPRTDSEDNASAL